MSAPLFGYTPFIYNNHKKKQCPISRHKNKTISPRTKFSTSFSPNTKLKLRDGRVIAIKDLTLGDVLEDGEIVNVILKVRNVDRVPFYRIFNSQLNEYIYVTGVIIYWKWVNLYVLGIHNYQKKLKLWKICLCV